MNDMSEDRHVSLQQYLESEIAEGKREFRVVAESYGPEGGVKFYIHPFGADGTSKDFHVLENTADDVTQYFADA